MEGLTLDMFNPNLARKWNKINEEYSIDMDTQLSLGRHGPAYRGWSSARNSMVAVRIFNKDDNYQPQLERLEANSLLSNPYLLAYYGHLLKDEKMYIFIEFTPYGTLRSLLLQQELSQVEVLKLFRQLI